MDNKRGEEARETPGGDTQEQGGMSGVEERNTETRTESAEDVVKWFEGLDEGDKDMLTWEGE